MAQPACKTAVCPLTTAVIAAFAGGLAAALVCRRGNPGPGQSTAEEPVQAATPSGHEAAAHKDFPRALVAPGPNLTAQLKIGVVYTAWNEGMVSNLLATATSHFLACGVPEASIVKQLVPGSYELPVAAKLLIDTHPDVDAVLCLGVLIRGQTAHFDHIATAVSHGLMDLQLRSGVPVLFGVLTCYNEAQAAARSRAGSDLPVSLATSTLHMAQLHHSAQQQN
eukprot:TRINITY_DN14723_c0_g1_i2.p1 TRINITY_DN14723_c0_g1~~TRINITY_DN14723_c0_g1_i2.p1  ORF type:complete len:223 (-),score=29.34 TRINITY_DN14723_c0_g1_i2:34-702(-)